MTRFTLDEFLAHLSRRMFLAEPPAANPLVATARYNGASSLRTMRQIQTGADTNFRISPFTPKAVSRDISPRMAYPSCGRRSDEDDVGMETQGNSSFQTVALGLYDVSADIGEQKNLADEYPDRVK